MVIFPVLAIVSYMSSLGLVIPVITKRDDKWHNYAVYTAILAILLHVITVYQQIFRIDSGQDFNVLNMASCVSLIICFVMTIVASKNRAWLLLPYTYGFAIIIITLSISLPLEAIKHFENRPQLFSHILLALFSYATLVIAALYAIQLGWINYKLKHKKFVFSPDMPPLMTIERKLFHITQIGFILLTLAVATGFIYNNIFSDENRHKAIVSLIAWFVYAILLFGNFRYGWRGKQTVCFSLAGTFLLTLAYFGSRFIQYIP